MIHIDRGSTVVKVLCYKSEGIYIKGTAVAQWIRCCATNRKVAGSIPAAVSGLFIDIILPIALRLGVDSARWLRSCATNRKVAGSIPAAVSGLFIDIILPIALWFWGRLSL